MKILTAKFLTEAPWRDLAREMAPLSGLMVK